jgi:hypothetical protein
LSHPSSRCSTVGVVTEPFQPHYRYRTQHGYVAALKTKEVLWTEPFMGASAGGASDGVVRRPAPAPGGYAGCRTVDLGVNYFLRQKDRLRELNVAPNGYCFVVSETENEPNPMHRARGSKMTIPGIILSAKSPSLLGEFT